VKEIWLVSGWAVGWQVNCYRSWHQENCSSYIKWHMNFGNLYASSHE